MTSRFAVIIFCAEWEDRYLVLRMVRHNAHEGGCTFCDAGTGRVSSNGVVVTDENRHENHGRNKAFYPIGTGSKRTDAGIPAQMQEASRTRFTINGIKGISLLYTLPIFRFDQGPIVEFFHNVFERVKKKYFDIIM